MNDQLNKNLEKIVQGRLQYKSDFLGSNLLISRLQKKYSAEGTPEVLNECLKEFHAYFEKYKKILEKDIAAIEKL